MKIRRLCWHCKAPDTVKTVAKGREVTISWCPACGFVMTVSDRVRRFQDGRVVAPCP
jgi:NMD protein affecting ribosome stability and mRNA decay